MNRRGNKKRPTQKIAVTAITSAIAYLCVLVGNFSPVGGLILLVVAGTMTMFVTESCGIGFGILGYIATGLLSITMIPFGFFYIMLIGPMAALRGLLFGKRPIRAWRYVVGYVVLAVFAYGISIALVQLTAAALGMSQLVASLGGKFVFALIVMLFALIADLGMVFFARQMNQRFGKKLIGSNASDLSASKPKTVAEDPFADDRASKGEVSSSSDAQTAEDKETPPKKIEDELPPPKA